MIVEDETLVSWSLEKALRKAGFEVTVVGCGEKAIEKLYSTHFDLVITDLKLPHIDGFQVAAAVKTFSPQIPVVMISAVEDEACSEKIAKTHLDCFVEKPFDLKEVTELVNRFVLSPS